MSLLGRDFAGFWILDQAGRMGGAVRQWGTGERRRPGQIAGLETGQKRAGISAVADYAPALTGPGGRGRESTRACGDIAIYHSPAYVFIIAMPLQRWIPACAGMTVGGAGMTAGGDGNGAGKHRFRLAPE